MQSNGIKNVKKLLTDVKSCVLAQQFWHMWISQNCLGYIQMQAFLALGAVLYQEHDGVEKVISYASQSLSKSESKYPVHK